MTSDLNVGTLYSVQCTDTVIVFYHDNALSEHDVPFYYSEASSFLYYFSVFKEDQFTLSSK